MRQSQPSTDRFESRARTSYASGGEAEKDAKESDMTDSNVVDWDGPEDAQNPHNWNTISKIVHVAIISLFSLNANLAATMYAPGAAELAQDFDITSKTIVTLTGSLYVLGFAIGPMFLAPLSELYGRLVIYYLCHVFFLAFILGCALSTNVGMFLAFRFIAGCAASGPMSVGGGSISDLYDIEARGKAMSLFALGPLLGPVIGPIIVGFVSENIGWRWTFRLIFIFDGCIAIATVALLRETNAVVLLCRKAAHLRKETGNEKFGPRLDRVETPSKMLLRAIVRPLKMLIFSPIVLIISLYMGFIFGLAFLLLATFTTVFRETYGFSVGIAGLAYLGLGVGMLSGLITFSKLNDKLTKLHEGQSDPEDRLILMKWLGLVTPIGFFWYGWSVYNHTHWIVPILGTLFIGIGAVVIIVPGQLYLVDAFGAQGAASALAANMLVRSLFGAFLDLAAPPLYQKLNLGWGNTVLGFICLAFAPVPFMFHAYGKKLRSRFPVDL